MMGKPGRKKRKHDKVGISKKESKQLLSTTGRPKRRCTSNSKVIIEDTDLPGPDKEKRTKDKNYVPVVDKSSSVNKKTCTTDSSVIVIEVNTSANKITSDALEKMNTVYKWMDFDEDTSKIRCKTCIRAGLRKWFILAGKHVKTLLASLKLHQFSEEHSRCEAKFGEKVSDLKIITVEPKLDTITPMISPRILPSCPQQPKLSSLVNYSPGHRKNDAFTRNVYCLPIELVDSLPVPDVQSRALLEKNGLKSVVGFLPTLSPAKLREDVSKAFAKTFNLRPQELLQFDYLAINEDKNELMKPYKLLHFDGETVLKFVGKKDVYVILKQKCPTVDINWTEILYQDRKLQTLDDMEYKEVMVNVMHRLNSGKHKDGANPSQTKLVDAMLNGYRLNNYHQLVYCGYGLQQLVLFNDKRREEAFTFGHSDHLSLHETFHRIFKQYYWNNIVDWVINRVKFCSVCMDKYGDTLADENISITKTLEDISYEKNSRTPINRQAKKSVSPREKSKNLNPPDDDKQEKSKRRKTSKDTQHGKSKQSSTTSVQQVSPEKDDVQLPEENEEIEIKIEENGEAPPRSIQPFATISNSHTSRSNILHVPSQTSATPTNQVKQAVVNPFAKVQDLSSPINLDTLSEVAVKPEPIGTFSDNLLPPENISDDIFPSDIFQGGCSTERDEALYEEDIEQAIAKNSRNIDESSYCTNAMWAMYLLQQRGTYCDFFIMLLPSKFNGLKKPKIHGVHKVVLSAISKRMRGMTKTTIKIGGKITCEGLESVIEFAYTGRLTGIHELPLLQVKQISTTGQALDINVDEYLKTNRPDFVKSTEAKIVVN